MSVRIKYSTEKGVQRTPVEAEIELPAEMIYRLVHSIREELQDPESIRNWESIATIFTKLIMTLKMQNQMRPPFFSMGGPGISSPGLSYLKSIEDIKRFLETAMGEVDDKQKFDDIFKEDLTEPDEIKKERLAKEGKKFKSIKVEGPEDKDNDNKKEEEKK